MPFTISLDDFVGLCLIQFETGIDGEEGNVKSNVIFVVGHKERGFQELVDILIDNVIPHGNEEFVACNNRKVMMLPVLFCLFSSTFGQVGLDGQQQVFEIFGRDQTGREISFLQTDEALLL